MTLAKAIAAARDALKAAVKADPNGVAWDALTKALSALPDKPMTEAQISDLIYDAIEFDRGAGLDATQRILIAIKKADVLYVEEK